MDIDNNFHCIFDTYWMDIPNKKMMNMLRTYLRFEIPQRSTSLRTVPIVRKMAKRIWSSFLESCWSKPRNLIRSFGTLLRISRISSGILTHIAECLKPREKYRCRMSRLPLRQDIFHSSLLNILHIFDLLCRGSIPIRSCFRMILIYLGKSNFLCIDHNLRSLTCTKNDF